MSCLILVFTSFIGNGRLRYQILCWQQMFILQESLNYHTRLSLCHNRCQISMATLYRPLVAHRSLLQRCVFQLCLNFVFLIYSYFDKFRFMYYHLREIGSRCSPTSSCKDPSFLFELCFYHSLVYSYSYYYI